MEEGKNSKKEEEKMEFDALPPPVQPTEEELTLESLTKILERLKSKKKPEELFDVLTGEELTTKAAILGVTDQQFEKMKTPIGIQNALKNWATPTGTARVWLRDLLREGVESNPGPTWEDFVSKVKEKFPHAFLVPLGLLGEDLAKQKPLGVLTKHIREYLKDSKNTERVAELSLADYVDELIKIIDTLEGSNQAPPVPTDFQNLRMIQEMIDQLKHAVTVTNQRHMNEGVLNRIVMKYYGALTRAHLLGENALFDLYQEVMREPQTSTKQQLLDKYHVVLNGPLCEGKPGILTAVRTNGQPMIVKVIGDNEANVISTLNLQLSQPGFIKGEIIDIIHSEGQGKQQKKALLMDRYITDVAHQPSVSSSFIFQQGQRIYGALKKLHSAGYVHLDVKLSNFLVDLTGNWNLCDFDVSRKIGDSIPAINTFFPRLLTGHVALPRIDFYLLGVHLVIELCCKDDLSVIQGHIGVDHKKVCDVLEAFTDLDSSTKELKLFICSLLENYYEKCPVKCSKCENPFM